MVKPRLDAGVQWFLASRWGVDGVVWLFVCATAVLLDGPRPLRFGLSPVAADVVAVAGLTVAVAVLRRLPVVAAAIPTALSFALNPDLYYENLLVAQLVLAFVFGRRTRRTSTGVLLMLGICATALAAAAILPDTPWVASGRGCASGRGSPATSMTRWDMISG